MTLPQHSPLVDFFRLSLRAILIQVAAFFDPIRSRLRMTALERTSARSPTPDSGGDDAPPMLVLMVYRAKNARLVKAFLDQIGLHSDVRLWALDEVVPELASKTLGCGPGTRFEHLNWLYSAKSVEDSSWVVVSDDDVFFVRGDLTKTIQLMRSAEFSLAQPGHSVLGWWTSLFNIARPFLRARDTNYVEQGPILIADPAIAEEIFPLPEDDSMGWGIEAQWYRIKEGHYRIGIIDDCRMIHCSRPATEYPTRSEMTRMRQRLTDSQVHSIWQLQSENGYWWKWQRTPSWRTIPPGH